VYAVAPGAGYDHAGVLVDLRVDDNPEAPQELARLVDLSELYFGTATNVLPLEGPLAEEVRVRLEALGHGEEPDLLTALTAWASVENYEMRLSPDGIDSRVLQALRETTAG
ncbi:putative peptidoglycan binding domain-containing protein, partial [Segeticoccus rhizosphaerae]